MIRLFFLSLVIVLSACAKAPTPALPETQMPQAKLAGLEPELLALKATSGQVARAELSFSNQGDAALDYNLSTEARWLVLSKASGMLAAATSEKIAVSANCLEAQSLSASLELKTNGGDKSIPVTLECQPEPALEASLSIEIKGLPEGASAEVTVTGGSGFSKMLSASETLTLRAGNYRVTAQDIRVATDTYSASINPATIELTAGSSQTLLVSYNLRQTATGTLNVVVEGLAEDVTAELLLSKEGYSQRLSQSQTLTNLVPGQYDLEIYPVSDAGASFLAEGQNLLSVKIEAGQTAELLVSYSCAGVSLPDAALHTAVQEATERTDYTCKDLEGLGKLDLASKGIQSIKGLKYAKNLTDLRLYKNPLSSIDDIKRLTKLERLDLGQTEVENLAPLSKLINLKELLLDSTPLADLQDLKQLSNVTVLSLAGTRISDISDVTNLRELKVLDVADTAITNIAVVGTLIKLSYLNVYKTQVSDLSPVANLSLLETLNLYETKVTDLGSLQALENLVELDLGANNLSNISALKTLNRLEYLYLDENRLGDIAVIGNLPNLKELYLNKNEITDIDALRTLTALEALQLDDNFISNIEPLLNLNQLSFLNLDRNCLEPEAQPTRSHLGTLQARALVSFAGNPKPTCVVP